MQYSIYIEADRFGGKKRSDLKPTDFVFSDEKAFPVMTSQDVKDAVSSWGRYKGKQSFDSFKSKLTALAKRKGLASALPQAWKESAMQIREKGRVYNKNNEGLIRSAYKALRQALKALDISTDDLNKDDDEEEQKKESSGGFSVADLVQSLQSELGDINDSARIVDVFPDANQLIYCIGWLTQDYTRVDYAIDDTGVASFSNPIEVSRKVTYVPTSDAGSAQEQLEEPPEEAMGESELTSDVVNLIEASVDSNGIVPIKIIQPGQGSSGYYPKEVLQRDGPKVFAKGTQMFWDHQTPREEAERPENSLNNLAAVLIEDAQWSNDNKSGPGLYARARVYERFRSAVNDIGGDLGVSIRASGKAKDGVIDGKRTPVVEALTSAKSIDFVTAAGAGGKVLELFESAKKPKEVNAMPSELELKVTRLQESLDQSNAERLIDQGLLKYDMLPRKTIDRLRSSLIRSYPLNESGTLDATKFIEVIEAAIKSEIEYLTEMGAFKGVVNLGDSSQPVVDNKVFTEELTAVFSNLGLSEAGVKAAVKGRE